MDAELRVGLMGAGWVTSYHLPAWAQCKDRAGIVAICDPNVAAAEQQAERFGIEQVYDSAEAMLEACSLDAVDICAPRQQHAPLVRMAADRSLAILCQKPLAPTLGEAQELMKYVNDRVPLMVHENWRFRAYYRRIKELLDEGWLGDLRHVQFEVHSSGMIPGADGERAALVRQPMLTSLNRMLVMEILIHHLDTLRFLVGDMDMVAARLERTNDAIVGEDVATLSLRGRQTGIAVHVSGDLAVHGAPAIPVDYLHLFGSEGTLMLNGSDLRLEGPVPLSEGFDADRCYRESYAAVIAHFLDGVVDGKPFETNPADNLKTLALVEDAYSISGFEKGVAA